MTDLLGDTPKMKALSLWQPWASLKAQGFKLHETRHWTTKYRGPIAIHAAKTRDFAGAPDELCNAAFGRFWMNELPLGAIIAVGELTQIRPAETVADHTSRADRVAGNFAHGRFAWRIDRTRRLDHPIPTVGRQGLFEWEPPADLEARLGPAIDHLAACTLIGWA